MFRTFEPETWKSIRFFRFEIECASSGATRKTGRSRPTAELATVSLPPGTGRNMEAE